ncbi:hypothetical protein [Streptomyces musisoli]|nr:hypothetical protein [Streptomyces musisoli]
MFETTIPVDSDGWCWRCANAPKDVIPIADDEDEVDEDDYL